MSAVIFNWHGIVGYQSVTNVRRIGSADITSTLKNSYKTRIISVTNLLMNVAYIGVYAEGWSNEVDWFHNLL
jgi:hypothetical protein